MGGTETRDLSIEVRFRRERIPTHLRVVRGCDDALESSYAGCIVFPSNTYAQTQSGQRATWRVSAGIPPHCSYGSPGFAMGGCARTVTEQARRKSDDVHADSVILVCPIQLIDAMSFICALGAL